jgi:hypothetical protein
MYEHPTHFVKVGRFGYPVVMLNDREARVLGGPADGDIIRWTPRLEVKPWPKRRNRVKTKGTSRREVLFIAWENGKSVVGGQVYRHTETWRHTEAMPEGGWIPETVPELLAKPDTVWPNRPPCLGRGQHEMVAKCMKAAETIAGRALGADKDYWLNNPNAAADRAAERAMADFGTNQDAINADWEADADAFFGDE